MKVFLFFFPAPHCDKQNMKAKLCLLLKITVSNTADSMGNTGLTKQPTQFKHISAQCPCFLLSWENDGCQCCLFIPVVCGTYNDCLGIFIPVCRTQGIRTTKLWQLLWQGELFCSSTNVTSELRNRSWKVQLTKHFKEIFPSTVM